MQPDSPIVEARFVALLRGINVGGNKPIKMADLRQMFAALGYQNVKTALASGNVAWDAAASDLDAMRTAIATSIASTFGFSVPVLVLPQAQVQALVEAAPFAGIDATGDTRFYVTSLPEPVPAADPPAAEGLEVVRVTQAAVCSWSIWPRRARSLPWRRSKAATAAGSPPGRGRPCSKSRSCRPCHAPPNEAATSPAIRGWAVRPGWSTSCTRAMNRRERRPSRRGPRSRSGRWWSTGS
ncbi:MAG: DUF1697 domain-containing protein [Anaerolineae bacterium]